MARRILTSLFLILSWIVVSPLSASSTKPDIVGVPNPYPTSYLDANGLQVWGINLPIDHGYINVANGDVHLEIPLGNHPQRGDVTVNESIVYDSRFWHIGTSGSSYQWQPAGWPTVGFNGWHLPLKYDGVQAVLQAINNNCDVGITWTDYSGAAHQFIVPNYSTGCSTVTVPAYALDGSGYVITTKYISASSSWLFYVNDQNGTQEFFGQLSPATYPVTYNNGAGEQYQDRNGNCLGTLCSTTDTLGHTPIVESQTSLNGNGTFQIFYDVLTTGGATKRYTVNVEQILVTSSFNESGVSEFSNYIYAIQSIQLPDNTEYSFSYDPSYGELQTMTLPTGGVVNFYYQNFLDSYQNQNRWIYSYEGGTGAYQFTPSVVTQCSGSNKTGCQEQMTVTPIDGSGNYVKYLLTLNGGAWNTQTDNYEGGTHILSKANNNTLENSCPSADSAFCTSATWLASNIATTTLEDTGQAAVTQTDYAYPQYGKVTSIRYWDYGVPTISSPTKHLLSDYTYMVNGAAFLSDDAELDSTNTQISKNIYKYDEQAPTPTSGLSDHGAAPGARGNLTSVVSGVSATVTKKFTYDDAGQVLTSLDPNLNQTSYSYSCSDAYLSKVTLPIIVNGSHLNQQTVYDCNLGLPTQTIGMNSESYGTSYDSIGRVSTVTHPDGGGETYSYPSATETDVATLQTSSVSTSHQHFVDSFGRPSQDTISAPEGEISSEITNYDNDGRVHCATTGHLSGTTSPTDGTTCNAYDILGRVTQVTMPDNNTVKNSYVGNTTTVSDEMSHLKQYSYDAFGRLISVLEPNASNVLTYETDYQYNGFDKLTRVDQWGGPKNTGGDRVRLFGYDSLGRLIGQNVPENASSAGPQLTCTGLSGKWTNCYQYDANGNQTSAKDNRSITITSTYDALNRILLSQPSDGTWVSAYGYDGKDAYGNVISPAITYGLGRLTHTTNEVNTASRYYYDIMGRLQQQTSCNPIGCGYAIQMAATYDLAGNMTSLTYPDGRKVSQSYDKINRLTSINYAAWNSTAINTSYLSSMSYAPPGEFTGATLGNGIMESAHYNPRQSLSSLSYSNSIGALWGKNYTWDKTGANLSVLADPTNGVTRQMSYDPLNRITAAADSASSPGSSPAVMTLSGSEQSVTRGTSTYATATLTLSGTENVGTYYPCGEGSCPTSVSDTGTVTLVVNGTTVSTNYGANSTSAIVAGALVNALNSPTVGATVSGSTITFKAKTAGTAANGIVISGSSITTNTGTYRNAQGGYSQLFTQSSYTWYPSSTTLSGGASPGTTYDTGTVTVSVDGTAVGTANYGNGATTSTLASALASSINGNSGSVVNGSASGASLTLTCRSSCTGSEFTTAATVSNNDTADFPSGSFTTQVQQAVADPTPTLLNESYNYDPWGNLQQSGSFSFAPTFSTSNQMSTYAYDAAGNETNDGLGNTFTYDGFDRFLGANGYKIYTYDVSGNRVQSSATTPTQYIYFGNQLIATQYGTSPSTATWTDFIYGGGGLLAEVAGTQSALPTYRVTDHLTSLGGSIDSSGHFSGELGFAPFGQPVSGGTSDAFRFTGLEFDTFTGLDHATARQYHPNQGRWISPDPYSGSYHWANPQSLNRYGYVTNRAMTFTDPEGLDGDNPIGTPGTVGGCLGAAISGGENPIFDIQCGVGLLSYLFGGSGPSFHGTLKPRPGTGRQPWDDTFGIPYGGLQNGIGQALGLPSGGCEFGACGGGSLGFEQGQANPSQAYVPLPNEANGLAQALRALAAKGGRPKPTPAPVPKYGPWETPEEVAPLSPEAVLLKLLTDFWGQGVRDFYIGIDPSVLCSQSGPYRPRYCPPPVM
jgi:RHS repeat-associated protein